MKIIWLSHILNEETPLYGGAKEIIISKLKSIDSGDSCNAGCINMPLHSGTHVDAPLHFIKDGDSVDTFKPESWIFKNPAVINCKVEPGQLITPNDLCIDAVEDMDVDFVIIKTDFEKFRRENIYWEKSPGLSPDCCEFLLNQYKNLKGVGFDFISISSLKHRDIGRKAHLEFLKKGLLLFEDMSLKKLPRDVVLKQIIALPLRIKGSDGSPVSIIGFME